MCWFERMNEKQTTPARKRRPTADLLLDRVRGCDKVVKADGPEDLVFQSVKDGRPMNDGNILKRHIRPAARSLGLKVNGRSLRTSCATWMVQAGADPKSVQGQMRHSRIDHHRHLRQFVPEGQKQAVKQLRAFVERSVPNVPLVFH
jgi:integrase